MKAPQEWYRMFECEDGELAAVVDIAEIETIQKDARAELEAQVARLKRTILVCLQDTDGLSSYDVHDFACMELERRRPGVDENPSDDDYIAAWCEIARLVEVDKNTAPKEQP